MNIKCTGDTKKNQTDKQIFFLYSEVGVKTCSWLRRLIVNLNCYCLQIFKVEIKITSFSGPSYITITLWIIKSVVFGTESFSMQRTCFFPLSILIFIDFFKQWGHCKLIPYTLPNCKAYLILNII